MIKMEMKKIRKRFIINQALGAGNCFDTNQTTTSIERPMILEAVCPNETKAAKTIKLSKRIKGCTNKRENNPVKKK